MEILESTPFRGGEKAGWVPVPLLPSIDHTFFDGLQALQVSYATQTQLSSRLFQVSQALPPIPETVGSVRTSTTPALPTQRGPPIAIRGQIKERQDVAAVSHTDPHSGHRCCGG